MKKNSLKRIVSAVILAAFFLNETATAATGLPANISLFPRSLTPIQFSPSVAEIEDSWKASATSDQRLATSGKTIYLIQDAHTNPSGQMNI